jgi:hypothetical protein
MEEIEEGVRKTKSRKKRRKRRREREEEQDTGVKREKRKVMI